MKIRCLFVGIFILISFYSYAQEPVEPSRLLRPMVNLVDTYLDNADIRPGHKICLMIKIGSFKEENISRASNPIFATTNLTLDVMGVTQQNLVEYQGVPNYYFMHRKTLVAIFSNSVVLFENDLGQPVYTKKFADLLESQLKRNGKTEGSYPIWRAFYENDGFTYMKFFESDKSFFRNVPVENILYPRKQ